MPGPYLGAPPGLPSIKGDPTLGEYLRRFALWCQGNFNSSLQKRTATGELYLESESGDTVWVLTIGDDGRLKATQLTPGSADPAPGAQTLTFAPVTLSGMRQVFNVGGTASTTMVMMGLGFVLSSQIATRLWATINGTITNDTNNGQTLIQLYEGTGTTPPSNGSPAPGPGGRTVGLPQAYEASTGGGFAPFSLTGSITVTPLVPLWVDIGMRVTSGVGTISNITATAMGLA